MGNGSQILTERRRKGIRQSELAKQMGINRATLVDLERERVPVNEQLWKEAVRAMEEIEREREQSASVA